MSASTGWTLTECAGLRSRRSPGRPGLDRAEFTSHIALRQLQRLGFPTSEWRGGSAAGPAAPERRPPSVRQERAPREAVPARAARHQPSFWSAAPARRRRSPPRQQTCSRGPPSAKRRHSLVQRACPGTSSARSSGFCIPTSSSRPTTSTCQTSPAGTARLGDDGSSPSSPSDMSSRRRHRGTRWPRLLRATGRAPRRGGRFAVPAARRARAGQAVVLVQQHVDYR